MDRPNTEDQAGDTGVRRDLNKAQKSKSFPARMMELLDEEVAPEALWWLEDGKTIAVNLGKIEEQVLNVYFQRSQASSFTRRMNKWNFRKIPAKSFGLPKKTVAYQHPLFQRALPYLLKYMSDKKGQRKVPMEIERQLAGGSHTVKKDATVAPQNNSPEDTPTSQGGSAPKSTGSNRSDLLQQLLQQQQHRQQQLCSSLSFLRQQGLSSTMPMSDSLASFRTAPSIHEAIAAQCIRDSTAASLARTTLATPAAAGRRESIAARLQCQAWNEKSLLEHLLLSRGCSRIGGI